MFYVKYYLLSCTYKQGLSAAWELMSGLLSEEPCVWRAPLALTPLLSGASLGLWASIALSLPPGPLFAWGGRARSSSPSPFPGRSFGPRASCRLLGRCCSCSVFGRVMAWVQQPSWAQPPASIYPPLPWLPGFPPSPACPAAHGPVPVEAQTGLGLSFRSGHSGVTYVVPSS